MNEASGKASLTPLNNEREYLAWFDALPLEYQQHIAHAAAYYQYVLARNSAALLTRLDQREAVIASLQQRLVEREAYIQDLLLQIPAIETRER
jgi:hypothetical protein